MALILDGTDGITSSGGTNVLQDDAVITANIANGAVVAAKIADGAVTAAKLAAGAVPAPSTADVLSATAGASVGAVGTYAMMQGTVNNLNLRPGATLAGSGLRFTNAKGSFPGVTSAGTWRLLGDIIGSSISGQAETNVSTWLRIS